LSTLADQIEKYLKNLLDNKDTGVLELRRVDLAEIFMCVPSQINYVLETRFTNDHGYHVESRRGGGGYLRIIRLSLDPSKRLNDAIQSIAGQQVTHQAGVGLINRLKEEKFLTKREAMLIQAIIENSLLKNCYEGPDFLRGRILQTVLVNILRKDFEKEGE
jgi:transcriptional regulator CtsR